jgi:hypothetical protein
MATFATNGAFEAAQGGNPLGGASTGIGWGSNQSGQPVAGNFTVNAVDRLAFHIGYGPNDEVAPSTMSASNTGQILNPPITVTAGSGYTNGTYRVQSTGGGAPAGAGEIIFTVAGGAITSAYINRAGSGFTSAPTWTVANATNVPTGAGPGAGTGGAFVTSIGYGSQAFMLGTGFGANKNFQRLAAAGAVAVDAAVTPSTYLNRSGRALVAGDTLFAVEP